MFSRACRSSLQKVGRGGGGLHRFAAGSRHVATTTATKAAAAATATTASDYSHNYYPYSTMMVNALLVTCGGIVLTSNNMAYCEENKKTTTNTATPGTATTTAAAAVEEYEPPPNPVWPSGIAESDIDALVDDCLKDPSINIQTVPDYLERQIYRSTIKLTLNAIYQSLASVHGMEILGGHEMQIVRRRENADVSKEFVLASMRDSVKESVLEQVVDGLMANKAVNQPLIPDVVERQLYTNCLKIIFRILDMVAATFTISCCGHDIRMTLEPSPGIHTSVHESAISQSTKIDPEYMLAYARQMGLNPEHEVEKNRSWFDRFFRPTQAEFMAQLHATLYCLVLGIMDDVLAHTKIRLLSDSLEFDIVSVPLEYQLRKQAKAAAAERAEKEVDGVEEATTAPPPEPSIALPLATFTAGMGIGLVLNALLEKRQ